MNKAMVLLSGVGIGAGTMYFYDPELGAQRRVQVRERLRDGVSQALSSLTMAARELQESAGGPGGVEGAPAGEPGAQPGAQLALTAVGGTMALFGLLRRGLVGSALTTMGLGLLSRGLKQTEAGRAVGLAEGRRPRGVLVQQSLIIQAPLPQVYGFWRDYQNFPRFMTHVRDVREIGPGRSRWVVAGPLGVPVEWDAVITQEVPGQLLAWQSVPGSLVENAGQVRFQPVDRGTLIEVQLSYSPPAGMVGQKIAELFGADPRREIIEDLSRMKALLETGDPNAAGGAPGPGRQGFAPRPGMAPQPGPGAAPQPGMSPQPGPGAAPQQAQRPEPKAGPEQGAPRGA